MRTFTLAIALACMLVTAPAVLAEEGEVDAPEESHWGLCTAQEASQDGDEASNGTVSATPPFSDVSREDCDSAEHPASGTPAEEHIPENPGEDPPDEDDNPGDEHSDGGAPDDQPDEEENPGDDRRP